MSVPPVHDHHHHAPGAHRHHPEPAPPPVSLLRMSLLQRLGWALAAVAVIWIGVVWAMRTP